MIKLKRIAELIKDIIYDNIDKYNLDYYNLGEFEKNGIKSMLRSDIFDYIIYFYMNELIFDNDIIKMENRERFFVFRVFQEMYDILPAYQQKKVIKNICNYINKDENE